VSSFAMALPSRPITPYYRKSEYTSAVIGARVHLPKHYFMHAARGPNILANEGRSEWQERK
jgi:hypothetical protein